MTKAASNNAPKCEWRPMVLSSDGCQMQQLYVEGRETPYFVTSALLQGHETWGDKHGLHGAGMGASIIGRDGHERACARPLMSGSKIGVLKHRAEQMALSR